MPRSNFQLPAFSLLIVALLLSPLSAQQKTTSAKATADVPAALNFTMKSIDGKDVSLSTYKGKVVMLVNVQSVWLSGTGHRSRDCCILRKELRR